MNYSGDYFIERFRVMILLSPTQQSNFLEIWFCRQRWLAALICGSSAILYILTGVSDTFASTFALVFAVATAVVGVSGCFARFRIKSRVKYLQSQIEGRDAPRGFLTITESEADELLLITGKDLRN